MFNVIYFILRNIYNDIYEEFKNEDNNKEYIIEDIKILSELFAWGDKNDENFFE